MTKHPPESKARKDALKKAGVTYDRVAERAEVSWRMVKFWMDCQRTSAKIEAAYYALIAEAKQRRSAA